MKKILILAILGMFFISLASAALTYPLDVETDLKVTCLNDGFCSSAAFCTINIVDPLSNLIVTGENMTNQTTFFNYTITPNETGQYCVSGFCTDAPLTERIDYCFDVTPTGAEFTEAQGLILLGSLLILIIIAGIICYLGVTMQKGAVQISLISFSMLILIFTLGFSLNLINTFVATSDSVSSSYSSMYVLFTVLLSAGIAGLMLYLIFISLTLFWESRGRR